jgi:hypothetical protein
MGTVAAAIARTRADTDVSSLTRSGQPYATGATSRRYGRRHRAS